MQAILRKGKQEHLKIINTWKKRTKALIAIELEAARILTDLEAI